MTIVCLMIAAAAAYFVVRMAKAADRGDSGFQRNGALAPIRIENDENDGTGPQNGYYRR